MTQVLSLIQRRGGSGTIQRPTTTTDVGGSFVRTWANSLAGINVFLQIRAGSEAVRYGRENTRRFGTAYVAGGLDIVTGDRLTFGGLTYDIQSVRTPDERAAGDRLAYMILEVQETKP